LYTTEMFADFLIDRGEHGVAISTLTRVLEVYKTNIGENNVRSTFALHYLGRAYAKENKYDLAVVQYKTALEIIETYFGKNHMLAAEILMDLSGAFLAMGSMEEAKEFALQAEKLFTAALGKNNLLAVESHFNRVDDSNRIVNSRDILSIIV